jgi:hypothetical protein
MASDPVVYRTVTLVYAGCVSGSRWSCPGQSGLSHDVGAAGCGTERDTNVPPGMAGRVSSTALPVVRHSVTRLARPVHCLRSAKSRVGVRYRQRRRPLWTRQHGRHLTRGR